MTKSRLWRIIWWVYVAALVMLVVIKFDGSFSALTARIEWASQPGSVNYNLIPFRTLSLLLRLLPSGWARWAIYNLLGNFIPFVPFGFLLPRAYNWMRSTARTIGTGFLSIVCIELFQLVTGLGIFDVDDIILNTVGILCGYVGFRLAERGKDRKIPPSQSPPAAL